MMELERENINNEIARDLETRNKNWSKVEENDQKVTAQLAQMESGKASINYVDAVLMDIAKGGPNSGPQGPFKSISALHSYDFPDGKEGTWLVFDSSFSDGAHSFMWDSFNSVWKDLGIYQATGLSKGSVSSFNIAEKAVNYSKTDFIKEGINLFNKDSTENVFGRYYSASGDILEQSGTAYSHKILVKPGDVIRIPNIVLFGTTSNVRKGSFFTFDGVWIDRFWNAGDFEIIGDVCKFTVPAILKGKTVDHIRVNLSDVYIDTMMVVKNIAYPAEYIFYETLLKNSVKVDYSNILNIPLYEGNSINHGYKHLVAKVIAIGDSLTDGGYYANSHGGASIKEDYPYYLERLTGWNVEEAGTNGRTGESWWRLDGNSYDFSLYDTAIIWLGTNGGLTDTITEDTTADDYNDYATTNTGSYCKIIEKAKEGNPDIHIHLVKVNNASGSGVTTTNEVIEKIANKYSLPPVIDLSYLASGVTSNSDIIHPNNSVHFGKVGNIEVARGIYKTIIKHINENLTDYERILIE